MIFHVIKEIHHGGTVHFVPSEINVHRALQVHTVVVNAHWGLHACPVTRICQAMLCRGRAGTGEERLDRIATLTAHSLNCISMPSGHARNKRKTDLQILAR